MLHHRLKFRLVKKITSPTTLVRSVSTASSPDHYLRPDMIDYLKEIMESRVYEIAKETPLAYAQSLSEALPGNNKCFFKREDLQVTFSFNVRGAYNKIANLSEKQRQNGIVACSAGNHAQGVAYAAQKLGVDALIVVPEGSNDNTILQAQEYGAQVVLHGNDFKESAVEAFRLAREHSRALVHPFDDPLVIAGQGTVGLEIIKQTAGKAPDAIFVPVGGGGLISGVAAFVAAMDSNIKVIGVEPEDANVLQTSLEEGDRLALPFVNPFTDEASICRVGREPYRICREHVHEVVTVNTDEICAAIKDTFGDTRSLMEPLGAISVAGMKKYCRENKVESKRLVAVLAAANMDFDRLRFVSERADDQEKFLSITVPQEKGYFHKLYYDHVYPRNVTELSYRMASDGEKDAILCISIQENSAESFKTFLEGVNASPGCSAEDLSMNEMAKSHLRHMVGGRTINLTDERVFRLEFPEHPGALKEFLQALDSSVTGGRTWNISLLHYRNHGADIGRVLVGFQVPSEDSQTFNQFLQQLDFPYVEETNNPIYQHYLK